jgi:endonuclease-3
MLSSQTKDAVTSQAVVNLHQALPGGLTAESLAGAPSDTVAEAINKVGFWRRKTEYIQDAARTLLKQPGEARGDVPQTIEELCQLKGVGPKMGFLALQAGWNMWVKARASPTNPPETQVSVWMCTFTASRTG